MLAMADAYRLFAKKHPGRYAASVLRHGDREYLQVANGRRAHRRRGSADYGLVGDDAIHAIRGLRALMHGFVSLEAAGVSRCRRTWTRATTAWLSASASRSGKADRPPRKSAGTSWVLSPSRGRVNDPPGDPITGRDRVDGVPADPDLTTRRRRRPAPRRWPPRPARWRPRPPTVTSPRTPAWAIATGPQGPRRTSSYVFVSSRHSRRSIGPKAAAIASALPRSIRLEEAPSSDSPRPAWPTRPIPRSRGRKPSKQNLSDGRPDSASAVIAADGPGTEVTTNPARVPQPAGIRDRHRARRRR
jgi:hypothetical protein